MKLKHILLSTLLPALTACGPLRDQYCNGVTVEQDPKLFSIFFAAINGSRAYVRIITFEFIRERWTTTQLAIKAIKTTSTMRSVT